MIFFQNKKTSRGFTLLEVLVATFIITISMIGIVGLFQQTVFNTVFSASKLTAAYLAQEGIEIVRNIRDENWLRMRGDLNAQWDENIPDSGDWEADYSSHSLVSDYGTGTNLNLVTGSGFYGYDPGIPTHFKRKITVSKSDISVPADGQPDMIKVIVQVEWTEKNQAHYLTAQENLYNWR
ncbi:MAG: hypothetical protein COT34_01595 [Candidatus Nealsonbacteria bacterium CG08_land_8_20_14_0_20_43_11]|uniref:Type IV pilus modification protein PilV n=1 Tax=Candidatus Nealsonbacteria bacterium CG08_land_8_20_14_0_20_43_11 TaxID=1974706 RepID=A0A2M6T0Y3_9BACT|nr:MAG: hypothetical protein COT34_01595 [Candidatus Nealsonbacteria bacterium CG08_land_8_20_14_0_20_43_11]